LLAGTPKPSDTPEPLPSDKPLPTDKPLPSDKPEPSDKPQPSDTPKPLPGENVPITCVIAAGQRWLMPMLIDASDRHVGDVHGTYHGPQGRTACLGAMCRLHTWLSCRCTSDATSLCLIIMLVLPRLCAGDETPKPSAPPGPKAVDDKFNVAPGAKVTANVMDNDVGINESTDTVILDGAVNSGTGDAALALAANGTVTYTGVAADGTVTFKDSLRRNGTVESGASVNITVTAAGSR
jgi:hypothetical protein